MASCSAYGCMNRPSMKIPGVTFHKFPTNVEIRGKWIKAVRRKNWVPSKNSYLCSEHFASDQFDHSSFLEVRLIENAAPTIFKANPDYVENLQGMDENSTEKKVPRVNITENKFSIDGVCAEMIVEVDDGDEPAVSSPNPAKILTTNQDGEMLEENNTDPQKVNFAKTLGLICPGEKGDENELGLDNDMPEVKREIISDEFEESSPIDSTKATSAGKDSKKKKKKFHKSGFLKRLPVKKKKNIKVKSVEILPGRGMQLGEIDLIEKCVTSPKVSGLKPFYRILFNIWPLQELHEIKEQILEFSGFNFDESSPDFKKRKLTLKALSMVSVQNICTILGLEQADKGVMIENILKFLIKPHGKSNVKVGRRFNVVVERKSNISVNRKFNVPVDSKMLPIVLVKKVEDDPNLIRKETEGRVTYITKDLKKKEAKYTKEAERKSIEKIRSARKEVKKAHVEKKEISKSELEKKAVKKTEVEKSELKRSEVGKREVKKETEKKEFKKVEEKKEVKKVEGKKEVRKEIEKDINDIKTKDISEPLTIHTTPSKHGRIRKEKLPYSPPEKSKEEVLKKPRGRPSFKQIEQLKLIKRKPGRPPGIKTQIKMMAERKLEQNIKLKAKSILQDKFQRDTEPRKAVKSLKRSVPHETKVEVESKPLTTPRRTAEKRKQPDHYGEWIRDDTSDTFSAEEVERNVESWDDDDNDEDYETNSKILKLEEVTVQSSDSEPPTDTESGIKLKHFPSIRRNIENASSSVIERLHVILYGTSQTYEEMKVNLLNFDGFKFLPNSDEWKQKTFFLSLVANNYLMEFTQILNLADPEKGDQKLNNLIECLMNFLKAPCSNYLKDEESAVFSEKKIKSSPKLKISPPSKLKISPPSKTPNLKSKKMAIKTPKSKQKTEAAPGKGGLKRRRKMLMDESEVRKLELEIAREERAKRRSSLHDPLFKGTISFYSRQDYAHSQAQSMLNVIRNNRALKAAGMDPIHPTSSSRVPKLGDNSHVQFMVVALNYPDLDIIHNLIFLQDAVKSRIRRNILDFRGFAFDESCPGYANREKYLQGLGLEIVRRISFILGLTPLNTHLPMQDLIDLILHFLMEPSKLKQVTIKEFPPNFFQDYPKEYKKTIFKATETEHIYIDDTNNSEFSEEHIEASDKSEQEAEPQDTQSEKNWTTKDLDDALQSIADGSSVASASAKFNIPQKTLRMCLRDNQQQLEKEQKCIREADMENLRAMSSSPTSVSSESSEDASANTPSKVSKSKGWTSETLKLALIAVKKGSPISHAASEYNIPRTTLNNYVKQIWGGKPNAPRESKISSEPEKNKSITDDDDDDEGIPIAEVFTSDSDNRTSIQTSPTSRPVIKVPRIYDETSSKTSPKLVQTVMPVLPVTTLKNSIAGQTQQPSTQICYILKPGASPVPSPAPTSVLQPLSSVIAPSLTTSVQPTFVLNTPTQSILTPQTSVLQPPLQVPAAPSTPIQLQLINSAGDSIAQPGKQIFFMKLPQPNIPSDNPVPPLKLLPIASDNTAIVPPLKLLPVSQEINPISPTPAPINVQQNSPSSVVSSASLKSSNTKIVEQPVRHVPRAMKSFPNTKSRVTTLPSMPASEVTRLTESSAASDDSESNRSNSPEHPQVTLSSDEEEEEDIYDDSNEIAIEDDSDPDERAVFLKVRDIIHSSSMEDITLKKITDKLVKSFPNLDPSSNQELIKNSIKKVISGLTSSTDD